MRPSLVAGALAVLLVGSTAFAKSVRYFGIWSYAENAPREEIRPEDLDERDLGYWALEFNGDGAVRRGTFHGADGTVWLALEYVRDDGHIYADLYDAEGTLITRKSTQLEDRKPRWPEED